MTDTAMTRKLNDEFRTTFQGGRVMATRGVLARSDVADILRRVREFADFTQDNDPHGEHDFGAIRIDQDTVYWKLDAYNLGLEMGSPDPCDPAVTTRVLTVMLAEEY